MEHDVSWEINHIMRKEKKYLFITSIALDIDSLCFSALWSVMRTGLVAVSLCSFASTTCEEQARQRSG